MLEGLLLYKVCGRIFLFVHLSCSKYTLLRLLSSPSLVYNMTIWRLYGVSAMYEVAMLTSHTRRCWGYILELQVRLLAYLER